MVGGVRGIGQRIFRAVGMVIMFEERFLLVLVRFGSEVCEGILFDRFTNNQVGCKDFGKYLSSGR